jgi:hypothetical protein
LPNNVYSWYTCWKLKEEIVMWFWEKFLKLMWRMCMITIN